CQHNYGAPPTF
nr:immunoglobulin light chain junction region [Macaca mulatta]